MPFDFKKEYKEFYMPKQVPAIITIPPMNYIAVSGTGNPNEENGEYKEAVGLLYAVAYTLKMSKKSGYEMKGFFDYVVPPLEGLWWQQDSDEKIDYSRKNDFNWISMIRLPDFVSLLISYLSTMSNGLSRQLQGKKVWIAQKLNS